MKHPNQVLVTGGAGFISSHVVDQLLADSVQVTVLDRKTETEAENLRHVWDQITYVSGDIRDRELLRSLISADTAIIHLAAVVSVPESISDPLEAHDVNVNGTLHVFEAARHAGVSRVVYASSAAVYGNDVPVPTPETATLAPASPYGLHKKINEEYAWQYWQHYGLSSIGLRFFNVCGPRQDPSSPYSGVISIFNDRMQRGEPITIFGDGEQTRDFVFVKDVAALCVAALSLSTERAVVCNIGTAVPTSINAVYAALATLHAYQQTPAYMPARAGDIRHSCADTSFSKTLFRGYETTSFVDAIASLSV